MINLKDLNLENRNLIGYIRLLTFPESYLFNNIEDFNKNKELLKTTSPYNLWVYEYEYFKNKTILLFPSANVRKIKDVDVKKEFKSFNELANDEELYKKDVTFGGLLKDVNNYIIYDTSGELEVFSSRENFTEGTKIHNIVMSYYKERNRITFLRHGLFNKKKESKSLNLDFNLDQLLQPI